MAKLNTIRVLLAIAVNLEWPLQQFDVKNVFLNDDFEGEVYMDSPSGFGEKIGSIVCKLKKSLYHLNNPLEHGSINLLNQSKDKAIIKDKQTIPCS